MGACRVQAGSALSPGACAVSLLLELPGCLPAVPVQQRVSCHCQPGPPPHPLWSWLAASWDGKDRTIRQELVTKSHAVETLPPHQRSVLYAAVRARSARVSPCTWDKITPLLTLMSFLLPPAASPAVLRPCGSSFCLQTCLRAFARAMSSLQKAFLPRGCLIFITQAWLMCHLLGDTFPCQPV